jgi:hypothetical protein
MLPKSTVARRAICIACAIKRGLDSASAEPDLQEWLKALELMAILDQHLPPVVAAGFSFTRIRRLAEA